MLNMDLTSRDVKALASPAELMDREWAPCRYNCPVHADVRKYIEHIAQGRFGDGVDVIRERPEVSPSHPLFGDRFHQKWDFLWNREFPGRGSVLLLP